jgi:hypothetical protein
MGAGVTRECWRFGHVAHSDRGMTPAGSVAFFSNREVDRALETTGIGSSGVDGDRWGRGYFGGRPYGRKLAIEMRARYLRIEMIKWVNRMR